MSEKKPKNIYQRLHAIMEGLKTIEKDTEIKLKDGKGYKATSHDAASEAVKPLLVEHGVIILPSVLSFSQHNDVTVLEVLVRFQNIDDKEDFHEMKSIGYGQDFGDKGPGKAFSYAVKTAILKTFTAKTGENDEERVEGKGFNPQAGTKTPAAGAKPTMGPSEAQLRRLFAIQNNAGVDDQKLKQFMEKTIHVPSRKLLKPEQYQSICNLLESGKFFEEFGKLFPEENFSVDECPF